MNVYTFISWQRVGLVEKKVTMSSNRLAWRWIYTMLWQSKPFIVLVDGVPLYWSVDNV